ncbi:pantoate--beta-alanine ligase [Jannaschia sp. R86511]|uniref:pantoate--beta-alanine ligase n=1 Tax=Jannaschia sp. R86511 TaxID=3093853 RepID=UPI0036D42B6A
MGGAAVPDTAERAVGAGASGPLLVTDRAGLASARAALTGRVAVVMTMGALHDGHRSLLRLAAEQADHVVVTVFVNPLQFGPGEDLDAYPRTLEHDLAVCAEAGVDLVFAPSAREVYPEGEPQVRVRAGALGEVWEGRSRPGHFDGVLTVVMLLLHLVRPDAAVFGRKDRQQLALVQRMVADLAVPVRVVPGDTVREPDGLARSSRNAYLRGADRDRAAAMPRAGRAAVAAARAGAAAAEVVATAADALDVPGVSVDYCALVGPQDLAVVADDHTGPAVLLLAARVGGTRLIDNVDLVVGPGDGGPVVDVRGPA